MFCKSSKLFWFAAVFYLAFFFGFHESGFASIYPPTSGIPCSNGEKTITIYGQKDCPPGYWNLFPFKRIYRDRSVHSSQAPEKDDLKLLLTPKAGNEPTYDFTHILEGEWDDVVGYIGFRFTDPTTKKDFIACLIGLPVVPLGNNQYKSVGWDKKIFWIDVGDGTPMHVCAIYTPNYEEDGKTYDNVYWAPNFQYLPPGVTDETLVRPCDMWLFLSEDDEVEEVWIDVYDENWEIIKTKELAVGDRIQAFTTILDPNDPDALYGLPLEDRFQTVKNPPIFLYEHMTPNVDFVNENTKSFDYENVDLLFILYGSSWDEEDVYDFAYSTPKDIGMKWGNKPAKAENWFLHGISGILNFFMPSK